MPRILLTHQVADHLCVVLAERPDTDMPYVTWLHNIQSGGYSNGNYFNDYLDAIEDFVKRTRERLQ